MEDLENWAVTHFSAIENKNVTVPDLSEPVMAFDEQNLGQILRYNPILDKDKLSLYWILQNRSFPWLKEEWKSRLFQYFARLIGHEGENSLFSYLKEEDYAMELNASDRRFKDWMSLLKIDIILTKKGLNNTDKVIDAVFKYL